jgi:hypothetical protein
LSVAKTPVNVPNEESKSLNRRLVLADRLSNASVSVCVAVTEGDAEAATVVAANVAGKTAGPKIPRRHTVISILTGITWH